MIVSLRGQLLEKHPDHAVLDVSGVGYKVWITLNTYERLPRNGSAVFLLTHLIVREDSQDLFGFSEPEERELFRLLIGISGIGGKTAISILSGARIADFKRRIGEGDVAALKIIPGIGPKMAQRIVVELSDKLEGPGIRGIEGVSPGGDLDRYQEAVRSLMALGYKNSEAQRAVRAAAKNLPEDPPLEDVIRAALSKGR